MNERAIKVLILSVSLGWATQGISQETDSDTNAPVDLVGHSVKIYPATPLKKILWGGVALLNPSDQYMPVPLYGYSAKKLKELDDSIYEKALSEAAMGNVHIAVAGWDYPDAYKVQGVRVNPVAEDKSKDAGSEFFNIIQSFCVTKAEENEDANDNDDCLIAFTRPLKLEDEQSVKKTEFIASPDLWRSPSQDQASARLNP